LVAWSFPRDVKSRAEEEEEEKEEKEENGQGVRS
jgi:hypothetical protein